MTFGWAEQRSIHAQDPTQRPDPSAGPSPVGPTGKGRTVDHPVVVLDICPDQRAEVRELHEGGFSRQVRLNVAFDKLSCPNDTDDEFHRAADLVTRTTLLGPGIGHHDDDAVKGGIRSVLDSIAKLPSRTIYLIGHRSERNKSRLGCPAAFMFQ